MSANNHQLSTLGDLIRMAREGTQSKTGKHLSQEEVAGRVQASKQWISRVESGSDVPSLELLAKLHAVLAANQADKAELPLAVWLLKWVEAQVPPEARLDSQSRQPLFAALEKVTAALGRPYARQPATRLRSLADFPLAFEPLTIIAGDRREDPPRTRGDIFAYSVSITDLSYILQLGLQSKSTVIKSDKLFAWMDDERLEQEFGHTNLLVIGSPSVNLAARRINNLSVFQFAFDPEIKAWEQQLRDTKELNDRQHLRKFWQIARSSALVREPEAITFEQLAGDGEDDTPASRERVKIVSRIAKELLRGNRAAYWMNRFRKPGFMDPIDGVVHGLYTREDNDFGLISVAQNPFAKSADYVCIFVAGIHGPGTAHALRWLAGREHFDDHPFGGIIEVELDLFNQDIPNRFENVQCRWQTGKYTPASLLTTVSAALHQARPNPDNPFARWTAVEKNSYLNFVRALTGKGHLA